MKTIEEKARQRAFEIASSLGLNIAELIVALHDLYIEAATESKTETLERMLNEMDDNTL